MTLANNIDQDRRSILFNIHNQRLQKNGCIVFNKFNNEDNKVFVNSTNCPRTFGGHCASMI